MLPGIAAKIPKSTKFVKAEVMHQEPTYVAHIKLAPAKINQDIKQKNNGDFELPTNLKRDKKQDFKE
jgi:hypothetical protein